MTDLFATSSQHRSKNNTQSNNNNNSRKICQLSPRGYNSSTRAVGCWGGHTCREHWGLELQEPCKHHSTYKKLLRLPYERCLLSFAVGQSENIGRAGQKVIALFLVRKRAFWSPGCLTTCRHQLEPLQTPTIRAC